MLSPFLVRVMLLVILVTPHSSVQRNKGPGSYLSIASYNPRVELLLEARITSSLRHLTGVLWDGAETGLWIFFSPFFHLKKKEKNLFPCVLRAKFT